MPNPIYLVTKPTGDGVNVTVVGCSASPIEAEFTLRVVGNGNVSVHRGSAQLGGGQTVVLSSITLGILAQTAWEANLSVRERGGAAYEQTTTTYSDT